jgi:hypothetical protein
MRTQPDPVNNMFNALTYFVLPKSFLDRDVSFYLLVKDESEPSLSSMPHLMIGTCSSFDGKQMGLKLQELLLDPGHPTIKVEVVLNEDEAGA